MTNQGLKHRNVFPHNSGSWEDSGQDASGAGFFRRGEAESVQSLYQLHLGNGVIPIFRQDQYCGETLPWSEEVFFLCIHSVSSFFIE